jgi:hypothetical protein
MSKKWRSRGQLLYNVYKHLILNNFFAFREIIEFGTQNATI